MGDAMMDSHMVHPASAAPQQMHPGRSSPYYSSQEGSTPGDDIPEAWTSVSSRTHSPAPSTSYNSTSTDDTIRVLQHSYEGCAHVDPVLHAGVPTDLMSQFCQAAWSGNGKEAQVLLQAGAPIDAPLDPYGCTALMQNAAYDNLVGVETLLELRADVNVRCLEGKTSLIHALEAYKDRLEQECNIIQIVETLISHKANLDTQCHEYKTALMHAVEMGEMCSEDEGKEVQIAEILLENGCDPDVQDAEGWTALVFAASKDLPQDVAREFLQLLIKHEADVNMRTTEGRTALSMAVEHQPDLARLLLEEQYIPLHSKDAISRCNDIQARAPLHYAVMHEDTDSYVDIVDKLLQANADINVTASVVLDNPMCQQLEGERGVQAVKKLQAENMNALMFAAARNRKNSCDVLLKFHADPDVEAVSGLTALMFAAGAGSAECVKSLLDAGADSRAVDQRGFTAADWATEHCADGAPSAPVMNPTGHQEALNLLRFHEHQRAAQESYHSGICHRTQESTQGCCRQTLYHSRCCDHDSPVTFGGGQKQGSPEGSSKQRPRKNRALPGRSCESCELCTLQ